MSHRNVAHTAFLWLMIASMTGVVALTGVALWPEWRFRRAEKATEEAYKSGDPSRIRSAIEVLGKTRDIRAVPILIETMYYEDDAEVQLAAREGLCSVGHRPKGFGTHPPEEATIAEWVEEIARWKSWYRTVCPQDGDEDIEAVSERVNLWRAVGWRRRNGE